MSRYRSKLLHAGVALALLVMSAALWPSLGASATSLATVAVATATTAACPTPGNNVCISNTPTVALTLNGKNQTVSYRLAFTLDNGQSGNWHATITTTQFTAGGHTLPVNASIVTAVATASACAESICPGNTIGYPVQIVAGTPATFYDNTGGDQHGVGTFTLQATINVVVPGNTYAGTYTSTITIAFLSGP